MGWVGGCRDGLRCHRPWMDREASLSQVIYSTCMLLTISTSHQPATDLGYLLHKNPGRLQTEQLSFGTGYVFYPEASTELCTAALLIEIDPVALVRGRGAPITLKFANAVGEVLTAGPSPSGGAPLPFMYYI